MSIFSGINQAKIFDRSLKLSDGNHVIKIDRCLLQKSARDRSDMYIVEFTLVESDTMPTLVGKKFGWTQNLSNKVVAEPNLKSFVMAVVGMTTDHPQYSDYEAKTEEFLEASVGPQNFFKDRPVAVNVQTRIGKESKKEYKAHNWRVA